ncbi:MAG TPA: porin family protein, partial [Gemmatimonadales bacterium]|nr:porin family protein [Gemmatimonadales bacterium]
AAMTLDLGPYLALRPELAYVEKGVRFTGTGGSNSVRLGYLELPVQLALRLPLASGTVSPHLSGGGSVGFRLDCRQNIASGSTSVSQSCGGAEEPTPRRFEASLVFGAGVDVRRLRFGARFELGMTRLGRGAQAADIKNRTFYLLAGTSFR